MSDNNPVSGKSDENVSITEKNIFSRIPKWAPAAVLLFTAILYSQAIFNGFTSFDDDFYILKNPFLKDFSWHGVKAIFTSFYSSNYHPLTTLTYLIEYNRFGLNPLPYHLLNVILHLFNTWFVFMLAERLSGKRITALVVSVFFAVHPMHVESVAWVAERKDVLYAFFYLLSLLYYLRYMESGFRRKYYIIILFLFLASLLSKATAVSLPVLMIAIDLYKGRPINAKSLLEKVPFLLLSTLFGIVNILAQAAGGSINNIATSFGFLNRIFLFTSAIAEYIIRLIVPYSLSGMHYFPVLYKGWFHWEYYASLPFLLLITWLVARRSSLRKEIVFGISFFLITIFLMLQVISVGSALISERYTYIAYIGLFYIAGQGISNININKWRYVAVGVVSVIVITFSVQTWYRIGIWKDDTVLFNDMIEKNPEVYFGYWMRGNFEKKDGNLYAALQDYNIAIDLNPDFEDSWYNRGIINDALGNSRAAIRDYSVSIRLNPKMPDSYNNRGWAYFRAGDASLAMVDFNKAISLKPGYTEAYNNRGWVYFQSGNFSAALLDFNKALQLDPNYDKSLYNRAAVKSSTGDLTGAIEDYNLILKRYPNDNATYYYRGMTYFSFKDTANACLSWQKAKMLGNQQAPGMLQQYCH